MKSFILCIVTIAFIAETSGQVVPSTCEAPDSVKALYQDDADRLALKKILGSHLPFEDSVEIPEIYSDSFLLPLLAVYNATSLPERDTVVTIYKIHEHPSYALNQIGIAADSTLPWMQTLRNGILPSGNHELDSILDRYGFYWLDYETWYGWFSWHFVTFQSASNYNPSALLHVLDTVNEVTFGDWLVFAGDGDHITIYREEFPFPSTVVIYFLGWGDCLAGCTDGRSWMFKVYDDCSVEFVGAYGSHVPFTLTHEIANQKISIQPNPVDDFLQFEGLNGPFYFSISDLSGRIVHSGYQESNRIENLSQLPPGIYFLLVREGKKIFTLKMFKG